MSEEETTIERCINFYCDLNILDDDQNRLLSELRTLRAHDEAWRAVASKYRDSIAIFTSIDAKRRLVASEVDLQIARLDAMKEGKA